MMSKNDQDLPNWDKQCNAHGILDPRVRQKQTKLTFFLQNLIFIPRNGSSLCDPTQGECFFRPEGPNRFTFILRFEQKKIKSDRSQKIFFVTNKKR